MGCFLDCFGPSKDKRKQRRKFQVQSGDQLLQRAASVRPSQCIPVAVQGSNAEEEPVNLVPEISNAKSDEEKSASITRKKVRFDANVQTIEHNEVCEDAAEIKEANGEGIKEDSSIIRQVQSQSTSDDVSIGSSDGSFTPNNRYANCRDSDDEDLGSDCYESDLEDDYDDDELDDDQSEDFNTPDEERNGIDRSRVNWKIEDDSNSPVDINARDKSDAVHPVLKPIENLTQWKAAKAKVKPQARHRKCKEDSSFDQESRISFGTKPDSFNLKSRPAAESKESSSREVSVDASLSNWLVSPGSTPADKKSPMSVCSSPWSTCQVSSSPYRSQEDRPILGALTVEEIRQFSATNSPRKSPNRSPDEIPIIGTVGTYWDHSNRSANNNNKAARSAHSFKGIPNTTSKYREDKTVNWHATPFETRLERALNESGGATC